MAEIWFLKKTKKKKFHSFQDTILTLAKDLGININTNHSNFSKQNSKYTRLTNLIQEVSSWFRDQLSSEVGSVARKYIRSTK